MYPKNPGIRTPPCSAMALTMKFGPLPMYVLAPMKTEPHEIAAKSIGPLGFASKSLKYISFPTSEMPCWPLAVAAKVRYVGALSRKLDKAPDAQKYCHDSRNPSAMPKTCRCP